MSSSIEDQLPTVNRTVVAAGSQVKMVTARTVTLWTSKSLRSV